MRRLLEKVKKDLKACVAKKDFQGANYLKMQLAKLKGQVNKQEKSFMASKQAEQIQLLNKAKIAIAAEVKQKCDAKEVQQGLVQQRELLQMQERHEQERIAMEEDIAKDPKNKLRWSAECMQMKQGEERLVTMERFYEAYQIQEKIAKREEIEKATHERKTAERHKQWRKRVADRQARELRSMLVTQKEARLRGARNKAWSLSNLKQRITNHERDMAHSHKVSNLKAVHGVGGTDSSGKATHPTFFASSDKRGEELAKKHVGQKLELPSLCAIHFG